MIRRTFPVLSLLLLFSTGCNSGGPLTLADSGPPPPHGGKVVRLSGGTGKGYVEVVYKPAAAKSTAVEPEVAFHFFMDSEKPYAPAPVSGILAAGKKTVKLVPQGDALVTPPGPPLFSRLGDVEGTLAVELDGKPQTIRLGVR